MSDYRISEWQLSRIESVLKGRKEISREHALAIIHAVRHKEIPEEPPIVINSPITVCDIEPTLTMSDVKIDQEERARHEPYNKKLY